jgi:HD-GYP domain-containing protein (c-di-GMP phosphodiesterase class II)
MTEGSSINQVYSFLSSKRRLWQLFYLSTLITVIINIFYPSPTLLVLYALPVIFATLIYMNLWIVAAINLVMIIICVLLVPGPPVWESTIIPFIGYVFISYMIRELVRVTNKSREQSKEFEQLFTDTIHAYAQTLDARDAYTAFHSKNVAAYAKQIATAMELPPDQIERIYIAGILHDTGKIGTPEAILNKQGKLTEDEFAIMKQHPANGYNILRHITYLQSLGIAKMVLHHHEKIDGSGYPEGLKGQQIPLGARIIAVCDAYDAMTTDRSYRQRMIKEEAFHQLVNNKGTQFDPDVVDVFTASMNLK